MKKNKNKILGIIPARSGSKGVKNKNIKHLNHKPLVHYTIEAASNSKIISEFIVSTDSQNIANICMEIGIDIPFLRPKELATDTIESFPVITHALNEMEKIKGYKYDYFILLQPTSPLRTAKDIDNALSILINSSYDSIVSVVDVEGNHPLRMKKIDKNGMLINYVNQDGENMKPRQELDTVYIRNGCIYASKRDVLFSNKSIVGYRCLPYIMTKENSINIDSEIDFFLAEKLMSTYLGEI